MLDHIGLSVADYAKAKAFYDAVMPTIGASCVMAVTAADTGGTYEGGRLRDRRKPSFWIGTGGRTQGSLHIAFVAESRSPWMPFMLPPWQPAGPTTDRRAFGTHYHPNYYGAFVMDLDGHNIEAVCHKPA